MDLVVVCIDDQGLVDFSCRVCGQTCPAPAGVPLAEATRDFLTMHPLCAEPWEHEDGCPSEQDARV